MRPAAFFDRDGTINVNFGHVYRIDDLEFVPGTPEIIAEYNRRGVPVIVITNQAGIAKKMYTEHDMNCFNSYMNEQLQKQYGAHIDAFYYCPHHPDYTGDCECRKPKPGLFLKAALEWDVDLKASVMYGDKQSDETAARKAGIPRFFLIHCNKNL